MKIILAILCLSLVACETTSTGPQIKGTAAAKVREVVTANEADVRPLSALATDGVFAFALSNDQRDQIIGMMTKVSAVVAASGAQTPDQFTAAVLQVLPAGDQYAELATSLSHVYQLLYNHVNGDPKLLLVVSSDIAAGINQSCRAWSYLNVAAK